MTTTTPRRSVRFALTLGLAAIFCGLWLFLDAQGIGVPPFKRLWPTLFLLAGGAALVDYFFVGRRASSTGWGLLWIGFGVLGFTLTLGYTSWSKALDWLPSFPTIIGLALLTTWLADGRRQEHFAVAGAILVALGLVGYTARFEKLQRIIPSAQVIWAVLLLAVGGYVVWRTVRSIRS